MAKNNKSTLSVSYNTFLVLRHDYYNEPKRPKAMKEEICELVCKLLTKGILSDNRRIIYDSYREKFVAFSNDFSYIETYDKDRTVTFVLRASYSEFLPKKHLDYIFLGKLEFNPHGKPTYRRNDANCINTFVPSELLLFEPSERIDSINLEEYPAINILLSNLFKSKDRIDYFLNWLAVGFITKKQTGTAIVSKGVQGSGKGVFFEHIVEYAWGRGNTATVSNSHLSGRFNSFIEGNMFILANEIKADFRDGNSTYESMKMYITDSSIRIEEKHEKARTVTNYTNWWLHSNNDTPLQIQGGDRRYTVFNTKSVKLDVTALEHGYKSTVDLIADIKMERDDFIKDLMSLKYDVPMSRTPMHTPEKDLIYEASMTKIEILSDKIFNMDIEYISNDVEDAYSLILQSKSVSKMTSAYPTYDEFMHALSMQFEGNYITTDMCIHLYRVFVNPDETEAKIGKQFNKRFGTPIRKNSADFKFKYRKIDVDSEVRFSKKKDIEDLQVKGQILPSVDLFSKSN